MPPQSPNGPRRQTIYSADSLRVDQSRSSVTGGGRTVSYREMARSNSGSGSEAMMEQSAMMDRSKSMRLNRAASETLSKTHLSTSELENLARLFNAFATEFDDSDDEFVSSGQIEDAHNRVLEIADLKSLLLCLGIRVTDDIFDRMALEFAPRVPGELSFDEFVSVMVTSQELRGLRDTMEEEEKAHAFDDASAKRRFDADATWRWFWDAVVLFITAYYMLLISYEWVIPNPMTAVWWVAESTFLFLYIGDIVVYTNTRCRDHNGRPMATIQDNLSVYLRKTLVPDVLGALPIDLVISAIYPDDHHERIVWFIFRGLHLLRLFRCFGLFKGDSMHGFLRPKVVYLQYTIAPVLKALFYFVLVVHYLGIGWLVVQSRTTNTDPSYVDAMYIVLYTLSTVGYGDMIIEPGAQRVYCCFLFLGGVVMNGLVISQMSVFLSKADIQNDRKDKMRETLAVLKHFDIPDDTQQEILSFQHHVLSHNLGDSHEELLGLLPTALQESLGLFMRIKFIAMVPMFASSPRDCQEALANTLKGEVFQPHQVIMVAGEIGNEMYFLGHGAADVIGPGGEHYATLRKGAFFGEIALLVDGARRNASIKALTYCDTFLLQKGDFTRIMGKFPHFRRILEEEVADRVAQEKEKQKGQSGKQKKRTRKRSAFGGTTLDDGSGIEMPEFDEQPNMEASRRGANQQSTTSMATPLGRRGNGNFNRSEAGPSTFGVSLMGGHGLPGGAAHGSESPRHKPRPHRFGAVAQVPHENANHIGPRRTSMGGGGNGHNRQQRTSGATAGVAGQSITDAGAAFGIADPEMLAELAERVAMLERMSGSGGAPPIPSVYHQAPSGGHGGGNGGQQSSNAGKSKDHFPGAMIDFVSSDDETSSRASPRRGHAGAASVSPNEGVSALPPPIATGPRARSASNDSGVRDHTST